MSYLVIARKWRPMLFDDVIGQEHVTTTLKNAIESGRIAHAYIFSGPRGVGKTTTARILAKALKCENGGPTATPCGECTNCLEITNGRNLDVLEIDGASNRGIDEIRNIRDNVRYHAVKGGYKAYIIDEFHMITKDAFNALLKTLEEPPPQVVFIFATTEPHKIIPTILSRCQRMDFRRIPIEKIVERLRYICDQEKIAIDDESLYVMAQRSDGGMRDALTLLDQVISFCGTEISIETLRPALGVINQELFFELTDVIHEKDIARAFAFVAKILDSGYDITEFLHGLVEHVRNILVIKACKDLSLVEVYAGYRERYKKYTDSFSETDLLRIMNLIAETIQRLKWSIRQRLQFELAVLKLAQMTDSVRIEDIISSLDQTGGLQSGGNPADAIKKKELTVNETAVAYPVSENKTQMASKPSPPAVQQSATGSADIQHIESSWTAFVEKVQSQKMRVGAILQDSYPNKLIGNMLYVKFIGMTIENFHREIINKEHEYLTKVMHDVSGAVVKICCDDSPDKTRGTETAAVKEKEVGYVSTDISGQPSNKIQDKNELFRKVRELQNTTELKKVVELFDAQLIDVTQII